MNDPIVEEVKRYRMEHTRKFGGDLDRIYEDLRRIHAKSGCEVVRRPPKLLDQANAGGQNRPGNPTKVDPKGRRTAGKHHPTACRPGDHAPFIRHTGAGPSPDSNHAEEDAYRPYSAPVD